jgi:CheY-like chemotaxis protein
MNKKTILIVEDLLELRDFFHRMVKRAFPEATVLEAENGQQAFDIFCINKDIDLIITDEVMPEMRGSVLITLIRQTGSNVPIILTSGTLTFHELATVCLPKPVMPNEMVSVLHSILQEKQISVGA